MTVLYLTEPGTTLKAESRSLVVRTRTGSRRVPVMHLDRVSVMAPTHLTSSALTLCAKEEVPFVISGRRIRALARLGVSVDGLDLLFAQQTRARDESFRVRTARSIVSGKIRNQRRFLGRCRARHQDEVRTARMLLDGLMSDVEAAEEVARIRGLEGRASAVFFRAFKTILNPEYGFEGRNRRPPRDPANTLLSFAYTLLTSEATAVVAAVGLEPALGMYHEARRSRPAIALDLIEEFRTPVGDALVLQATGRRLIKPTEFRREGNAVLMSTEARRRFIQLYETKMTSTFDNLHGEQTSLRTALRTQASLLASAIRESGGYECFKLP